MPKKIVLSFLVVLLAAGLSACSVMQGTYQKKVDEADTLTKRLAALQKKHDDLAAENAAQGRPGGMTLQKDKLTTDLAYVTDQRDKAVADKEELDRILQSKSDTSRRPSSSCAGGRRPRRGKREAQGGEREPGEGQGGAGPESSTYESLLEKMKSEISKGR